MTYNPQQFNQNFLKQDNAYNNQFNPQQPSGPPVGNGVNSLMDTQYGQSEWTGNPEWYKDQTGGADMAGNTINPVDNEYGESEEELDEFGQPIVPQEQVPSFLGEGTVNPGMFGKQDGFGSGQGLLSQMGKGGEGFMGKFGTGEGKIANMNWKGAGQAMGKGLQQMGQNMGQGFQYGGYGQQNRGR